MSGAKCRTAARSSPSQSCPTCRLLPSSWDLGSAKVAMLNTFQLCHYCNYSIGMYWLILVQTILPSISFHQTSNMSNMLMSHWQFAVPVHNSISIFPPCRAKILELHHDGVLWVHFHGLLRHHVGSHGVVTKGLRLHDTSRK